MLKTPLLHPYMLAALASGGHGSKVLISDGNYPHGTRRGPNAELVFANFRPGLLDAVSVLQLIASAVPIEAAEVMQPHRDGPHALPGDPPIWADYRRVLQESVGAPLTLQPLEKQAFYRAGESPEVCLTVATGEQAIWANLLLTIGVVQP